MDVSKAPHSLHIERGHTDTSLVSERGKTDDSLADHRKQTEHDTDRRVESDRKGADEARAESRTTTDATTDLNRDGRSKLQHNRTSEEKTADETLRLQRQNDDEAVISERSLMDKALVAERRMNDVESNKFLQRERKETDRNLLRERTHTDSEVLSSSNRLGVEMMSHKATKAELTSRDEFLAIVSHDLRNPIGAILSYADLLLEDASRGGSETKQWAEVIKRNAQSSLRLIGDILDMERFAEGKLHMKRSPTDIQTLVAECVETFQHVANERGITLHVECGSDGRETYCDRDRIGQVIANLISNALKFTPRGGVVKVATARKSDSITVCVSDTGPGIPKDQQKRIFERYAQIGNKDRSGLGLGLYISAMLVDAHHGGMTLVSEEGVGSTFSFTLPDRRDHS